MNPIKPVPQLPQYRWNEAAKRYIDSKGDFIKFDLVRSALDTFLDNQTKVSKGLGVALLEGNISLREFRTQMRGIIKQTNLAGIALEQGGWYQVAPDAWGRVGNKIRNQYEYLENFVGEIASGKQPLNGSLWARAELYAKQGRMTYYQATRITAIEGNFTHEQNVLTPADHCDGCLRETAKGVVKIGELVPIGERDCLSNCRCYTIYSNPETGKTREV